MRLWWRSSWPWLFQIHLPLDSKSWLLWAQLTIKWIINMIKESKIDELLASLNGLRISHLLACHLSRTFHYNWSSCKPNYGSVRLQCETVQNDKEGRIRCFFHPRSYMAKQIPCFEVATCMSWQQTLEVGDGPCLPHSFSVMNTYTKMATRSKRVAVVVKKPDCCSNHHHQRHHGHSGRSHKCGAPLWRLCQEFLIS